MKLLTTDIEEIESMTIAPYFRFLPLVFQWDEDANGVMSRLSYKFLLDKFEINGKRVTYVRRFTRSSFDRITTAFLPKESP